MNRRFSALGALAWTENGAHSGELGVKAALAALFVTEDFPDDIAEGDLALRRDALGKPFVNWRGRVAEWAQERGLSDRYLHVSNSHDGGAHLVLAAYGEEIVGLGIDAVHLPRFRKIGKDIPYLHRFARHFMGPEELEIFQEAALGEDLDRVRLRVAAHFSLMEAASKACGTGLKMGAGMGTPASLAKSELGVKALGPPATLLFGSEAQCRLSALETRRWEAHWESDDEFLVSLVTFRR